jgi:enamine deaminase RidA (YjgF/YER057c/UK114 family)
MFTATRDLVGQVRVALENIVAVLKEASAKPKHITRMTWYVVDKKDYLASAKAIGAVYRELIGSYNAVMTAVQVVALIEDAAKVEIEVTAVIPDWAEQCWFNSAEVALQYEAREMRRESCFSTIVLFS